MTNYSFKRISLWVFALLTILLLGVTDAHASGSAYSRARAYLRSDAPSGSGKVYVGQAATSSPNYQTSSSSEKQGEKTTTTYHFYAQAATGYKFTGWYSKNANDEYVAASNSTVSGTTYTYTDTHYVVNVTSGSNPSSGSSYTDKDLYAGFIKIVQLSFIRPEDGSFTIMHNGAAVADYASFTVDGKVVLTATPDAGYKLRGWYTTTDGGVTKNYFAFAEEIEPSLTTNVTIGAEFVLDDGKADFWVKGTTTTYNDLNAANTAAAATSAKTIVLVNSGTLPAGTYTISSGVTLLIPYGSDYSKIDQPNIVHVTGIGSAPALSVYKKLSLAAGATINCSGKICVGGQMMSINGGNPTSVVRGRAGVLDLSRGGLINLNSGSALYAWGFVQGQDIDQGNNTSGVGTIDAKSGSTVWEVFQCGEWRGGTASSTIYSNRSSWKFFPFQSYTVQNIEAPITYRYGATGKCKWTIFGDGKIYTVDFTLIGSSNALFNMGSGATLNKRYDATTDRICYELNGTNAVNALSLSAMGETINSSEYRLPIPANMQITVTGGTTSISNQMVLHAGAYVDIRSGATLNINTNVYIFDQTDWDTYCMYAYYYRSYASLTKHYNRGDGTSKATLEDATVIVDGNLTFGGSGRLYSTTNGANIKGNNGGRITFGTLPTQTTIVMCKKLSDNVNVNVSSANMHNIDGSYTKSVASTTFHNVNGRWFAAADKDPKADHTYKFTYIKSGAVYGTGGTNATVNTLYRSGWIDVKADVCDDWWQGLNDTYLYNYTFNNAWHQYEQTPTVIGEGDEAATIYSGTDGKLYAKTGCSWEEYSGADANCLQTIGGVKKAFINGSFVALTKNTEDEAYHNTANATEYYICFKDICEWHAATKVAGANKAYTVTATSQKYIWYSGAWLAATQESPYFYTRSESGEKTYYEYVGSEWTEANVVAESTRNGAMTRYFNLPDAITDANDNTKPGESTTIKIMKNVTITSALTYSPVDAKGGTCTIDLNGFTLSGSIDNMITINHDKAVLVVLDQSPEETGKISISYSANNTRRRAVYVQNGRLMLNSGTIQATNSQAQVDAIYVNTNELCDINGGQVKATASSGAYGVHTAGGTARCTIKGGTITATSPASKGVYSEGGEIRMSAGTVNATTTGTEAMGLATTNTATSLITLTGGTVNATAASTAVGVQVGASGGTNGTATISGGTVSAKTTGTTARALRSYATTTVNGGTFIATAATSDARGITVGSGVMRINAGVLVNDTANTQAYAVYTAGGKTWVNGGQFRSATKNTTSAYGFYANAGTDTINGGDFFVTSKTTDAYGIFVPSTTPTVRLNGGKFMVKTSNGSAAGTINNTAASTNLVLAAGYFNVAPAGSYVLAGKEVKDLDATVEASLISAGYTKKIAGTEYTVTWKNRTGSTTLRTEKVESGKRPVWTGDDPVYTDGWGTYEFRGWTTEKNNGGTYYSGELPVIGASDVTYYASYRGIYAEVTTGGTTTKYYSVTTAWTAAMACQQAYIKVLCSPTNLDQLVFNPTPANAIITLDLNGYHWGMGANTDPSKNKSIFINVNKAGCKLIIDDSRGGGYLVNTWSSTGDVLTCAKVTAGELILQGGEIRVNNTGANSDNKKYSVGVQVNGGTQFTMTGGKVYSTDGYSPRGINVSPSGNAGIVGGTVHADATGGNAYGVLAYGTVAVGGDALVKATTAGSGAYPGYVDGGTLTVADSCSIVATAPSQARVFYVFSGGKITVNDKPTVTATVTSGNEAYACYVSGTGSEIKVNGGTYNISGAAASGSIMGVRTLSSGVATINNGTFTLQGGNNWTFGAFVNGGTVNINGGDFTVSQASGGNKEGIRVYPGGTCNITGGTFTVTKIGSSGGNALCTFGGTTNISGNPIFNAHYGITVANVVVASGDNTAAVVIDGGTYNTQSFTVKSINTTSETGSITGDVTVWDGKFKSQLAGYNVLDNTSPTSCLKIRGGWYSNNSNGKLATGSGNYVVSPSTVETLTSGPEFEAGYKYRVNTKYNVTWSVNGNTTVQEYNRNEMPSYGSTPTISDGNTREFLGWNTAVDGSGDTIAPVTTDVTYYAVFRVWEAEVIEGESESGTRFEHFADAWTVAQNLPVAKITMLSSADITTQLLYHPDSVTTATTTLDLNNHTLAYTGTSDRFVRIEKSGCILKVVDSSVAGNGVLKVDKSYNGNLYGVVMSNGELRLESGKIFVRNSMTGKASRGITPGTNATFTMIGGALEVYARNDPRAINSDGRCIVNITGGTILSSNGYDNSGTPAWGTGGGFGAVMWNYGTITFGGTAVMTVETNASAVGIYCYGSEGKGIINGGSINATTKTGGTAACLKTHTNGEITVEGGTFNARTATTWACGALADTNGKITINGGTFDAQNSNQQTASIWNIEGARVSGGATMIINGGTFTSSYGSSPIGIGIRGGTTTINGGTFDSKVALYAMDYADATQYATVLINGGTFIGTAEAIKVQSQSRDIKDGSGNVTDTYKAYANVTVNGGYFYSTGSYLVNLTQKDGVTNSTLVLNGGKYCEKSGTTTFKGQITARKGATTTGPVDIDETVGEKTYKYQLLTKFSVSWRGGESYSKDEEVDCGVTPSNTELVGKCFIRNDSAFYFTGWSPTPATVVGDVTYQAEGDYYEAEVKIGSGAWTRYTDFLEAWDVVQENANCTIKLLSNLTLTDKILYKPTVANARTTFDLNNFTLTAGGTADRFMDFNKADAILTFTDNSSTKGGKISLTRTSTASIYAIYIYNGELKMTGGKIYCQNNQDDAVWHPAIAVYISSSATAKLTMTDGTLESYGRYCIYPVYSYGTTDISGGTVKATATGSGSAVPVAVINGTTTIRGTAHIIASSTITANGASASAWVSADGKTIQQGTLNIEGGTIDVTASTQSAIGVAASAHARNVGGTVYAGHGTANISGGTITVKCSAATATQIFAAQCSETRILDSETPHHILGAEGGEMNISGGTFLVDTRNNGAFVSNGGNIDLLRSWGTLNVSGGTFTIYQNSSATGIAAYRGKTTVSGNPVFNVIGATSSRGIIASPWNHSDYCDADATKNLTEVEVNGGTFNVKATSSNVIGAWACGSISSSSVAGYAMSAQITINGGEFICTAPSLVRCLYQYGPVSGTYGTANRTLIVKGGKFKSQIATVSADGTIGTVTSTSSNIETGDAAVKLANLAGGYFLNNNQLEANVADTCVVTPITSAEVDPEYNNGYRYRIDVDYRVKVTHGAVEYKFLNLNTALAYARTVANPTITLIGDADFTGPYSLNPSVANWRGTLDLNNHTITSTTSTDRFFTPARADAKLTITDNSDAKGGVWNLAYERTAGGIIGIVVDQGELILAGGKVHVENTASGKTATGVNIWGTSAKFTQTGGKLEVKTTSNTATGVNMRGTTEVSGGTMEITSTGAAARGFILASDAGNSKYGSLTVSGSPTITISGGSDVTGIYSDVAGTTTTVSGGTFDITAATTSAYGVRLAAASTATISGGTFNMTTSGNNCYGLHIQTAGTINVTGGTFNVTTTTDAVNYWYNVEGMRIYSGASSEINLTGGTFTVSNHSKSGSASGVRTFSGTVNISGTTTITAKQCFRIVDQYLNDAAGTTAYINVSGGTFNSSTHGIYTNTFTGTGANAGKVNTSNFTITGGQFISTSANHIDAVSPTSLLHIQGGFFNERSGTASKTNLAAYVSDPYEVFTLETGDSHLPTYAYEVCQQRVAKVEAGGVRTYYTTVLAALNYAKTVANPTITILKDAPLTARWILSDAIANWHGILDLNGKTVTGTGTSYGIVDVTKAGTQLTIRDSSPGAAGKLTHEESQTAHWGINVNNGATLVLESGTIYVKNTKADVTGYTVGVCVNDKNGSFTQTGGKVEVHAARNVRGVYLYGSGTTTISGGEIEVATDLDPESLGNNAMAIAHDAASTLTINGTASLNATAASYAYGLYQNVASQTITIGGSATIEAHAATIAYGVGQLKASTINIQGNTDIQATATTDYAYGVYQEKGSTNVSASPSITVSASTKAFAYYLQNSGTTLDVAGTGTYTASAKTTANGVQAINSASATLGGGTFTATTNVTDGTYDAQALRMGSNALITVSGGTYTALAKTSQAQAVLATTNGRATITGGTFNANSTSASNGNVEVVRTWPGSVVNISGGTFNSSVSTSADAARALGGNLTISGGTFNTKHGVRSSDADISATATATVLISGGTFNCTEWTIWSTTVTAGGKTLSSDFTVTGGKFKTSAANKPVIYNTNVNGLKIQGGYYSNNSNLQTYCVAPKHVYEMTNAECSAVGMPNGSYKIEDGVATVTVSGTTTYYTTLADAFTAANAAAAAPTIQVLADITGIASSLTYSGSYNATLDLNNHTVAGTVDKLLNINASGKTFTITDTSGDKEGVLSTTVSSDNRISCVYITAGTLNMNEGKVYAKNTKSSKAASAIYVKTLQTLIVNDGTVESESPYQSYAIYGEVGATVNDLTTITINGGLIYGHTNSSAAAAGIYTEAKGLTVNNGTIKAISHTSQARGVAVYGGGATINGGTIEAVTDTASTGTYDAQGIWVAWLKSGWNGWLTIPSPSTVTVKAVARTSGASSIYLSGGTINTIEAGTYSARTKTGANAYGVNSTSYRSTISGGTFTVISATTNAYGIYEGRDQITISGNPVFNVSGTSECAGVCAYSITPRSNYFGTANVQGGTFKVNATSNAYGVQAIGNTQNYSSTDYAKAGVINVSDGTFEVNSTNAIGINVGQQVTLGSANASPKITTTGGKFKVTGTGAIATNTDAATANNIIQGGWYTVNDNLAGYVTTPYYVLSLAGQSPYLYEVAEAYTLTWTTDGDALTGTYTNGITKVGTSIVAPNTPTKTGYAFSAWTPAVAATMPAANTEYTATWTINSYDVTFDMQGHGSAVATQSINYNGLVSEPAAPTAANYVFGGWYKEAGCTNEWNFSSDHVTAATTLYAKWIEAVASVTIGGSTTYYETVADAFTAANGATSAPKITMLQDVSGISEKLSYTKALNCTLDLNSHTIAGTVSQLLYVSCSGKTFTIENTGGSENGKISLEIGGTAATYCAYVNKGTLQLDAGTIYIHSTQTAKSAYAVGVASSRAFTMNGGKVYAETTTRPAFGVTTSGTTTINNGIIDVKSASTGYGISTYATTNIYGGKIKVTSSSTGYGIDCRNGTTTVHNVDSIKVSGTTVYGAYVGGYTPTATASYNGVLNVENGVFDVTGSTGHAYGVYVYSGTATISETTYHDAGTANISGGTFIVESKTASKYAIGVYVKEALTDPDATPQAEITGGKFKLTAKTASYAYAVNTAAANTALLVQGGWYNITKGLDNYTAPTKDCNYYVQPLADATYKWQVSEIANTGFYADIVDVDRANSKLILNVTGWAVNGWPYSINGTAYEKTARETDRTLKIPYVGSPGDNFAIKVQKSDETIVSHRTYVIPYEVTSDMNLNASQTMNIFVNDGATLTTTNTVTVKNIYVAPDAKLVVNSGKTLTADTIFLRTTWEQAAELENKGTIASSTKVVYTRIIKDKDFHLFGLPLSCPVSSVRLSDGVVPMYTTGWVLRAYDEERRSNKGADDNNWTTLSAEGTIAGGAGYEMFSASAYYREFYFPVNLAELTNQVAVTYHLGEAGEKQAGWNAITSPFTHAYENAEVPEGLVVGWYQDGYGYYEQEIPKVIPPVAPFAIQATKNGYISFAGSSIVANAPRRVAAVDEEQQIQWIHLDITDMNGIGDQTSVYSHPNRYDAAFQTGIDVAKRSLTAARAIIYSSHAYGEMAFAGVADSLLEQGVALTVYSPKPQELTISMRDNAWLERLAEVWLIDVETGAQIDLFDSDYTFEANEGTSRGRLFLQGRFKAPQIATDLEDVQTDNVQGIKAEKLIIRDKLYIRINGQLYDATGKQVKGK